MAGVSKDFRVGISHHGGRLWVLEKAAFGTGLGGWDGGG